jgi:FtsZ-interacting cell division protein ZipA
MARRASSSTNPILIIGLVVAVVALIFGGKLFMSKKKKSFTDVNLLAVQDLLDNGNSLRNNEYLIEGKRIDAGATMAANERRIKADEKKDERELNKRIDTQTRNARADYYKFKTNKERLEEIKGLKGKLNLKPDNKYRIAAEKRLEEIKREEQQYIRSLPQSYELARIDDLIQESGTDNATSPYGPGVQEALDKYK